MQFCQVIVGFVGYDCCDREGAARVGEASRRIEAIRRDPLIEKDSSSIFSGIPEPQVERIKLTRDADDLINQETSLTYHILDPEAMDQIYTFVVSSAN